MHMLIFFFQENFLMHSRCPDKDIENFVYILKGILEKGLKKIFSDVLQTLSHAC